MKEWNKPELFSLGVENTFAIGEFCECGATTYATDKNTHYCHTDDKYHANGCKKTEGHDRSKPCNETHWDGVSHDSKCCCAPLSVS